MNKSSVFPQVVSVKPQNRCAKWPGGEHLLVSKLLYIFMCEGDIKSPSAQLVWVCACV